MTIFMTAMFCMSVVFVGEINLHMFVFLAMYLVVFQYRPMRMRLFSIYLRESRLTVRNIKSLPEKYIPLLVLVSAALSLFLELTFIRWQSTVFPFFAFYKNFGLLSCFAGLGIGYDIIRRSSSGVG